MMRPGILDAASVLMSNNELTGMNQCSAMDFVSTAQRLA